MSASIDLYNHNCPKIIKLNICSICNNNSKYILFKNKIGHDINYGFMYIKEFCNDQCFDLYMKINIKPNDQYLLFNIEIQDNVLNQELINFFNMSKKLAILK